MADGNGSTTTELAVPSSIARLNYFYGQLLAQADLKAEQSYHVVLRRLLQRETFGIGTVAGLRVTAGAGTTQRSIFVAPGLAMDRDGRELVLLQQACLTVVPVALEPSATEHFDATDLAALATLLASAPPDGFGQSIDAAALDALYDRLVGAGFGLDPDPLTGLLSLLNKLVPTAASLTVGQTLADWLFDALVGTSFVSLRYLDRGSDPAPSILDAGCCAPSTCSPTRVAEGVVVIASSSVAASVPNPYDDAYDALSECFINADNLAPAPTPPVLHACNPCLAEHLMDAWAGIPAPEKGCASDVMPLVPLARVYWSRFDRDPPEPSTKPRILSIDNISFRPLAPSPVVTRALFDAVTQCATPVQIPPRFTALVPANGARLDVVSAAGSLDLVATATGQLALHGIALPAEPGWQIDFYPTGGGAPEHWGEGASTSPAHLTITAFATGNTAGIHIAWTSPPTNPLEDGVYVWRINLERPPAPNAENGWTVRTVLTEIGVDGDPRAPSAVPSGDGKPGGVFEARFYVSND